MESESELPSVDACVQLFAAVIRGAIREARLGHLPAVIWLNAVMPDWERWGAPAKCRGKPYKERKNNGKKNTIDT